MFQIFQCAGAQWTPTIGDPTAQGWLTTTAYFCAGLLAGFALRVAPVGPLPKRNAYVHFWWLIIVLLTALGINKELDLQSLITILGKCVATRDGWYDARRHVQATVLLSAIAVGVFLLLSALVHFRKVIGQIGIAIVGVAFIATFAMVRAASFQHVELIAVTPILGTRVLGFLELLGIFLIALNAFWLCVVKSRSTPSDDRS